MITLPPRYIPLPARVVYSQEPAAIKDTFIRIFGLAWESNYLSTPALQVDDLITFLALARRTYYLHVVKLIELLWLRSETVRTGCVRFYFPPAGDEGGGAFSAKNCTEVQKIALEEDEEDLLNLIDPSSSSSSGEIGAKKCTSAKNCTSAKKCTDSGSGGGDEPRRALLRAAGIYPNQMVAILRDETITLEDILATLAHAYDPATRARVPRAVAGLNLAAGYQPEATYYGDVRHIPAAVLEKAGLGHLLAAPAAAPETAMVDDEDLEDEPAEDGRLAALRSQYGAPAGNPRGMAAERAWQAALGQLQVEMPRATFNDYVREAAFVGFDGETLTLAARSEIVRAWLEGRVKSTVVRMLTGLMNRTVEVRFVDVCAQTSTGTESER